MKIKKNTIVKKIAFSGAASIGKSTACVKLSKTLGYISIPDVTDSILNDYGYVSFGEVKNPKEAIEIRFKAIKKKIELEKNNDYFVSDKSVIDYLAYWITNSASFAAPEENDEFLQIILNHIKIYDLIFIPLWGRLPLEEIDRRGNDIYYNFFIH